MLPTAGLLRSRSWRLIGAKVTSSRCLQQRRAGAPVGAEGEHLAAAGIGCEAWSACHASAADGVQGAPREGKSASQHVKHRGRSITNSKGVLRRSPTGRLPEERPAPKGRLPLTRDVAATMERGRRDRERRSRSKTREDAEGGKPLIPHAILGIIGANALVYLCWQETSFRRFMGKNFAVSSAGVLRDGRLHTLVTSIFSHYDPVHMGVNLGCLLLCGKELIPILGSLRFLGLFLGAGTASSVAQVAWPHVAPEHLAYSQYELGLGASGAVNAVVAYNILSFPGRIIMVLMVAPMPAIIPGLVFLGRDCVGFASGDAADLNVAHMSGTAFGFAVWLLTARLRRGIPSMGFRF